MVLARSTLISGVVFAGVAIVWGLNYEFVRAGLMLAPPLWLATLRAGIGALAVAAYLGMRGPRLELSKQKRRDAMLLGVPNTALFFGLWFLAAGSILPGETAVIVYTFPFWVALLSSPILGRSLRPAEWGAIAGGFLGVALVSQPWSGGSGATPIAAVVELLGGSVSWAIGTVGFQRRFQPQELAEANRYQLVGGATVLLAASLIAEPTEWPSATIELIGISVWLGVAGTAFAYGAWFWLLGRTPAATLSGYTFLVPVVAIAASSVVFGERLDLTQAIGVGLVPASILAISRASRPGKVTTGTPVGK